MADLVTILDNRSNLASGVVEKYDSGIVDAGTFVLPVAHGLSTTPSSVFLLREIGTDWEILDTSSFLIFDAVNIYGNFAALGTVNIRIIAMGI